MSSPPILERGWVVDVREDAVDVRMSGSDACESCGCCSAVGGDMVMHDVLDRFGAALGELVEVEVPGGSRLTGSLVGYGVPVLALFIGYLAGRLLGSVVGPEPDVTGAIVALAAVAGTFAALRVFGADLLSSDRFRPRVRAIIPRNDAGSAGDGDPASSVTQ